jgi:hypothetical protein
LGRALLIFDLGVASTQLTHSFAAVSNRTGGLRAARHHQLAWRNGRHHHGEPDDCLMVELSWGFGQA